MNQVKKVYVVPHSHWDREWYFTIEDSNVLLCENLLHLMDVLESNEEYTGYVFDGQLSIVEEFLKICPEEEERLKRLIRDKRIFVGPWYTQTDSLLVNKESIIRNLLYGTRIGKAMGHCMEVGYLPDIFGQNAYLPSIFKGFDIEYSILQRGIYTDQLNGDLNFIWKSPDGEKVKANNIFLGYGPGKFLSSQTEYVTEKLLPILKKLSAMNKSTDNLLLPAGGDQVLVREAFPEIIKELNKREEDYEFLLSDYETFMKETWNEEGRFNNEIEGELIAPQKSRIHNTIRSQRYDIKKLNNLVENKILCVLEPLAVIGRSLGLKYPKAWLDNMWKMMFDAHAHDSIAGCNSDDTNRNIIDRLTKVNNIADGLLNILKKQLTYAISKNINKDNILVVFNTKPLAIKEIIESVIFTKEPRFSIETLDGKNIAFDIVNQSYLSGGKQIVVTAEGEKEIELPGYYRSVINMEMNNIPPMGYTTLIIKEEGENKEAILKEKGENTITNKYYEVVFNEGKLILIHKKSGQRIEDFMTFEDAADDGDSYDFSPLKGDEPLIIKDSHLLKVEKGSIAERMVMVHRAVLSKDLEERKTEERTTEFEVLTILELRREEEFIRVKHVVNNNIKDHRLRVLFKTPIINPEYSYADQGFSAIKHSTINPYLKDWRERKFAEAPVPIYSLENFAALSDERSTFALITKGIKEYEALENGQLALTLFRSVGVLGKDDLLWRPGRASGINNKVVYTPDAQMMKKLEFEYAVYFSDERFNPQALFRITEKYIEHYASYQKQNLNTFEERLERFEIPMHKEGLPGNYSLFHVDNDRVFMSTCKLAYEGDGVILRLFNPSDTIESVAIHGDKIKKIVKTNLYEDEKEAVKDRVEIPPKGYVTLKIKE
ncbi:glycoside hydrolase family 38 C-terminal domain-containing protein [Fonticella tunisiensis]|uniref:Alpha-mannosidase n=1 Tax=Fonticella tunisiensis TaxID=1096341 RepID=A0A4R7KQJ4_9CLOT|nr:glycoside hydrolase family 38 C-terminal domain-containing protein [Fonticella tunisiensis]TDT61335.1 alpha-mannosidase [Fonticella tunisiensis]